MIQKQVKKYHTKIMLGDQSISQRNFSVRFRNIYCEQSKFYLAFGSYHRTGCLDGLRVHVVWSSLRLDLERKTAGVNILVFPSHWCTVHILFKKFVQQNMKIQKLYNITFLRICHNVKTNHWFHISTSLLLSKCIVSLVKNENRALISRRNIWI